MKNKYTLLVLLFSLVIMSCSVDPKEIVKLPELTRVKVPVNEPSGEIQIIEKEKGFWRYIIANRNVIISIRIFCTFTIYKPSEWKKLIQNDPICRQINEAPKLMVLPDAKTG